jgi:uncharacterized protein
MDIIKAIAQKTSIKLEQIESAVELLDQGNTVPFIARYRKEATGGLLDEQLELILDQLGKYRLLEDRRKTILNSLQEQGITDPKVIAEINKADSMTVLEDLYAPYRPKRKTRASIAREKGLEGLANLILQQPVDLVGDITKPYITPEVPTAEEAMNGARDIVAEIISETPKVRTFTREAFLKKGSIESSKAKNARDDRRIYETYYEFSAEVGKIRPHQLLAIRRGEGEKVLTFKISIPDVEWMRIATQAFKPNPKSNLYQDLLQAIDDAGSRLLLPSIERDIKSSLLEQADAQAINVFSVNLKNLLLQPPLKGHVIMGIDPGYRTGCKVAVIDQTGKVLATGTIYPHEPQKDVDGTLATLATLIEKFDVTLISIGNGTASKETEQVVAGLLKDYPGVKYIITNEAGASVYSASLLARKELPNLDVSLRGAVSIARRIQDPLAELVKIDPKSIGVGMYQHDVNQKNLSEMLERVVSGVVNQVGVDLNTSSPALLAYIAGINAKVAQSIVAQREANGFFKGRKELKKVSGLGEKAFEQCAGFLRIYGGDDQLDSTSVHPESYQAAREILNMAKIKISDPANLKIEALNKIEKQFSIDDLSQLLGVGDQTIEDIIHQIIQPDSDPRNNMPKPLLRSDILSLEDLKVGMSFDGTVRNVTDFGAFIDIGIKNDVLLHRSKYRPDLRLKVGDIIKVVIETIDLDRQRVGVAFGQS